MADWGLLPQGFVKKELADVLDGLKAGLRAQFGDGINLTSPSRFSQFSGVIGEQLAELWQELENVWGSQWAESATGASLDEVLKLTGAIRLSPSRSSVTLACTGVPGTILSAQRVAQTSSGAQFRTIADQTIAAAAAWVASTTYGVAGARRTNAGNVYEVLTPGVAAGSGGPTGTGSDIVDGSAHWRYIGAGTGYVDAPGESVDYGPVAALAGAISAIVTPVSGWSTVTNLLDAVPGALVETDAAARRRRDLLLRATGNSAVDAIRSSLLEVEGVTDALVLENPTGATDANGIPAWSFECLVTGGADQDIADAIWASKPATGATFGSTAASALDSTGVAHAINFSRPTAVPVYVAVTATVGASFPADGNAQVKAALVAFSLGLLLDSGGTPLSDAYEPGDSVFDTPLYRAVFSVAGVTDITAVNIGLAPAPGSAATLAMAVRQLAAFDSSRITFNGV